MKQIESGMSVFKRGTWTSTTAAQKFSGETDGVEVVVRTEIDASFDAGNVDTFQATITYGEPVKTEYTATFTETGNDTNEFTAEIEVVEGTGGGTQLCVEPEQIHTASGPGTFTPIVLRVQVPDELEAEHDFATTYAGHKTSNRFKCRAFPNSEGIWWNVGEYGFSPPLWLGERLDAEDKRKQMVWLGLEDGVELKPGVEVSGIVVVSTVTDPETKEVTAELYDADLDLVGTYAMRVIKIELSVDGDGSVDGPHDGVANYLPGYLGDTCVLYSSGVYSPQGMKIVVDVGTNEKVDSMTFKMEGVTQYPGFCSNAGEDTAGKDYSFSASGDPEEAPGLVGSGKTSVDMWCKDFGGTCRVRVAAEVGGVTYPVGVIEIPLDVDGDHMADAWESQQLARLQQIGWLGAQSGIGAIIAGLDDEHGPHAENLNRGDGFPAFDEYRGFSVKGAHYRTNLDERDVFVHKTDSRISDPNATVLKEDLNVALHMIDNTEYWSSEFPAIKYRWVNRNGRSLLWQYCVIFKWIPGEYPQDPFWAFARAFGRNETIVQRGTPYDVLEIRFYEEHYFNGKKKSPMVPYGLVDIPGYSGAWRPRISTHELGHAMFIDHGPEYDDSSDTNHEADCIMRPDTGYRSTTIKRFCDQKCMKETKLR